LLTAIGFTPIGSSTHTHTHIYTQTIHRTTHQFGNNVGRAPSFIL